MLLTYIRARVGRQEGQALVEYALILSLIAVLLVGALTFMHDQIAGLFTSVGCEPRLHRHRPSRAGRLSVRTAGSPRPLEGWIGSNSRGTPSSIRRRSDGQSRSLSNRR